MIVGIDFDNTLACYDGLFHAEAVARGLLPATAPSDKQSVRDMLRAQGREEEWTMLQGHVYGPGLAKAAPYPGARECIAQLLALGAQVYIISHKTPTPYLGPPHNLHAAARQWLWQTGFHAPNLLPEANVFLEPSMAQKCERIATLGCTHFIDDLPEFLADARFPAGIRRILFAPHGNPAHHDTNDTLLRCNTWQDINMHLCSTDPPTR